MPLLAYSLTTVFTGEIDRVTERGRVVAARCLPGGRIFERMLPRLVLQTGCNHTLFSPGCAVDRDDWEWTATVSDPGTEGWPHEFVFGGLTRANAEASPAFTADWFAGGWIRFGTGASARSVPIARSSVVSAGSITLTLTRDPYPFTEIGEVVSLWPTCDGLAGTCQAKFDNFDNFGGHPFRPVANPSLVKLSSNITGGKK